MSAIVPYRADILEMIENRTDLEPTTKAQYRKAIMNYLATGASPTNAVALSAYAAKLPKSSRAFLKASIRLWGDGIALKAKAGATPENIGAVQATVYRIEALNSAIQVEQDKGQKVHNWLTQEQAKALLDSCNLRTIQGQRDKVVLGLLVGAGLRRDELASLTFEAIKVIPAGNKFRIVLNVKGKGAKERAIPINDKLAEMLSDWGEALGHTGPIARALTKGGAIRSSLSGIGIFKIVAKAGAIIGWPGLAPHDLRRTYAQLGFEAGVSIVQISILLGHENVATTQTYLRRELDLDKTISDFIPF